MKAAPNLRWNPRFVAIKNRPEPRDGTTLSNTELIAMMKAKQTASERYAKMQAGYSDRNGNDIEGEKIVEFALRRGYPLSMPDIKAKIIDASEANDRAFFIELGDILKKPPLPNVMMEDLAILPAFLFTEWVHWDSSSQLLHVPSRSLCYYSDKDIAEICRLVLGREEKDNTVTQARRRLGLKLPRKHRSLFAKIPPDPKTAFAGWSTAPQL